MKLEVGDVLVDHTKKHSVLVIAKRWGAKDNTLFLHFYPDDRTPTTNWGNERLVNEEVWKKQR